ncbi:MAG: hypothetical protein K6T78_12290 [Alicyclobacillus sp.]|nr:hypothetical protein [Alicyclobacillus sp.]
MSTGIEQQIVSGLVGLLTLVLSAGITWATRKASALIAAHTSAKTAETATTALQGLSTIATSVVQDFNQRVVSDAKKTGVWTPQLAQQVKADAVAAVKAQGGALIRLAAQTVGSTDDLVGTLLEQAVSQNKNVPSAQTS